MKRMACAGLLAGFLTGCSSLTVHTDWAREADFSHYASFAYQDTDQSVADTQPLTHERIVGAIKRELESRGLSEVQSHPNVYVTYYAEESQQVALDTSYMGYGYGPGWYWGGGFGSTTTTVRTYTRGTLIVDMWDASAKQLVWRGVVSDTISEDPQQDIKKINTAMSKMFRKYPPARS